MKREAQYLTILNFFNAGFQAGLLLFLPFIVKDLHLNLTQAGILGGVGNIAKIFLSIPIVFIAGKIGGFKSLLIAIAIYACGFCISGFTHSFLLLVILFLLCGVGFGAFIPVAYAIVTRVTEKQQLGKVMGIFTSTADLGRAGIAATISFFAVQFGWRLSAFISALVIAGLFIFAKLKFPRDDGISEIHQDNLLATIKHLIKNYPFTLSTMVAFFDSIASTSLYIFLPFLLLARGLSPNFLAIFIGMYFIGGFTGKIFLGRLTDKLHTSTVFISCELLQALLIVLLATSHSFILMGIFSYILGNLSKGTVPAATIMAAESVEKHETFEQAYAFNFVFIAIANALTPPLLGKISDHFGVATAFMVCAVAAVIAVIPAFLFRIHRQHLHLTVEKAL